MNLKFPKASGEEQKKKFNPFLQIEQEISSKTNQKSIFQNQFLKTNQFGNQYNKNVFLAAPVKFQPKVINKLDENNEIKSTENCAEASKLENKLFLEDFEEIKKPKSDQEFKILKNLASPNLNSINKERNFKGEFNFIPALNDFSKPFEEGKSLDNKQKSSPLETNLNAIAENNFSKKYNDISYCEQQGNYFNVNIKKANNKSALNLNNLKYTNSKNEENSFEPINSANPGLSQLHISQLNIGQEKANLNDRQELSITKEELKEEDNNAEEINNSKESNLKCSGNKATHLLSDPFTKNSTLNNQKKIITDNIFQNKNESNVESRLFVDKKALLPCDLLDKEIRNISKKVNNFKLKEEGFNEQFKNNENSDMNNDNNNNCFPVNNLANFSKKNAELKLPFPNANLTKKATNSYNNNNNFNSDLLVLNRNKNTKNQKEDLNKAESKETENFKSNLASTKDNSIASCIENSNSYAQKDLKCTEKADLNLTENITYAASNKNETLNTKNSEAYTLENKKKVIQSALEANQQQPQNSNFKPSKILKIKDPKAAINFPSKDKKQESAININLLKKKKITTNQASSVKKYAEQTEDYFLDLEILKRNSNAESKLFTEVELTNLNPSEKNKLAGKQKLNTDKRQYWGRFNQLNGDKIESYRVYRDEDLNFPAELQSKIHFKPENERFEDDMSSSDEIIHAAKVHYNNQFNMLKMKNFNFYMCNNLKYTQGLYWDD